MTELQIIWFILIVFLLAVYAVLDGFDIGTGIIFPFLGGAENRRKALALIGPFWDGNEVWLLTGGGAIFAAFPHVYATVFSGFYLALMLLLCAMIFRAVSIEFRNKVESRAWQNIWDAAFFVSSSLMGLLLGVAIGNILRGIPLAASMEFTGDFLGLLNPFSIMIGLLSLAMFATQGAAYLNLKSDGELKFNTLKLMNRSWAFYMVMFIVVFSAAIFSTQHLFANFSAKPALWLLPTAVLFAILFIPRFRPFVLSSLSIILLMAMAAAALFPRLVPAINDPSLSLTISNSSSSQLTLKTMLIIACIGMPFVIGYTIWIYRAFRGKLDINY